MPEKPLSIGLLGNAAAVFPKLLADGAEIDIVTDQTSAHDPLAYLPLEWSFAEWHAARDADPIGFADAARHSMAKQVEAMVGFQKAGAEVFDYGNNIRTEAKTAGYADAFAFPGFVPAYIRPLFSEGKGPFRWAALSGDPEDIYKTDRAVLELFPENQSLAKWIRMAGERVHFQGLPARICWLGYGERDKAGLEVQRHGRLGRALGPDRDRARPPRLGLGRLAVPRDRGHEGRLGRDRRLAAAQRARQHRVGRDLGLDPSRRRRRHRPLDPRRPGHGRGRHARWPPRSSRACSRTIPRWASSGTSMPATRSRKRSPTGWAFAFPCAKASSTT